MNKNSVRDNGEPGLEHWLVTLIGVDSSATTQTDFPWPVYIQTR